MTISYSDMKQAIGRNWYAIDPNLQLQMDRFVPADDRKWVEDKMRAMGELIGTTVAENAEITDKNPAKLVRWDREGDEINQVIHHSSALETKRLLWKNQFLHLRFSDEAKQRGRPVPVPLLLGYQYLLSQAETGMLCSIGMTMGVTSLIKRYGSDEAKAMFLPRLLDDNFDTGWDGSMYLTERAGGSDVGATETTAKLVDGEWKLNGFKWFCSNVDGDAIATLARPEGSPEGVKGLALFFVPKRFPDGSENGVHIRRIKDKLGTRAVPTGEIDFVNTTGFLLAGGKQARDGRGINRMMEFVTESRLAVAAMGAGIMRRVFLEAAIRASHRRAFGNAIKDYGMVREQLVDLCVDSEAASAMLFKVTGQLAELQDRTENPLARILVPLTKMRCTRGGIASASSALEIFGGNGYIENWPMARQLRDAQCHTIWEGTENILALDVLRSMAKHKSHEALLSFASEAAAAAKGTVVESLVEPIDRAKARLMENMARVGSSDKKVAMLHAGRLANDMADVAQACLLLDEATWELRERSSGRKAVVAAWFVRRHLAQDGRWHPGNEGVSLDLFDAVIGYDSIDPETAKAKAKL